MEAPLDSFTVEIWFETDLAGPLSPAVLELLLDGLMSTSKAQDLLLGMPAVCVGEPDAAQTTLRWVGVHATGALSALSQVAGVASELAGFGQGDEMPEVRAQAIRDE